jgi:hypothetical protein
MSEGCSNSVSKGVEIGIAPPELPGRAKTRTRGISTLWTRPRLGFLSSFTSFQSDLAPGTTNFATACNLPASRRAK